jgi:multicomponent K+:H+ antiporter subunit E
MTPRWCPHPAKSLLVAACWLLLRESVALPDLLAAALLGLVLPPAVHGFLLQGAQLRHWGSAVRLVGVVLFDIVVSNVAVARIVLWPWSRPEPAWLEVPYTLKHPVAVMLLAGIVTTTPGTVTCVVDETRRRLLIHLLDGTHPAAVRAQIQQRYERALKEIFE